MSGKWVLVGIGDCEDNGDFFKCCTCKRHFHSAFSINNEETEWNAQYSFCPWCGVKFDGRYENSRFTRVVEKEEHCTWVYYKETRPKYSPVYIKEHSSEIYLGRLRNRLAEIKANKKRINEEMEKYRKRVEEYMYDEDFGLMEYDPRGKLRPIF